MEMGDSMGPIQACSDPRSLETEVCMKPLKAQDLAYFWQTSVLTVIVPSSRWVGCGSVGDILNSHTQPPFLPLGPLHKPGSAWNGGEKGRAGLLLASGLVGDGGMYVPNLLAQVRYQGRL